MAKTYYWLKLKNDFFSDKPIKKLRKIAGGDTYTIIYLKLQLLSLKNEGKLFFDSIEDSFAEELALDIDEDADNVKFTLMYLTKCGLIEEVNSEEILMCSVPALIGKETDSAQRVREHRRLKALQCNKGALQCNKGALQCNNGVTTCNTEIEKEKDIDIEKEKEKEKRIDYNSIAVMYNDICISFPRIKSLSDSRKKAIKARLNTYNMDDFELVFKKAEASDFLKGKNSRDWQASFDWMLKDANFAKVLDGNYDNKASKQGGIDSTLKKQLAALEERQNEQRGKNIEYSEEDYF